MKDNRFFELVNLYIDRQITAAETAELEAEMQASPRRRAIYRQYCQMHHATKSVYESFRVHAGEPQANATTSRGVIANFEHRQRQRRYGWIHYAGALAAAACLTLVFVRFNASTPPAAPVSPVAQSPMPKVADVPTVPAPERVLVELPPGPTSLRHIATVEPNYPEMLMALRREEKRAFENSQIQPDRMTSLFDDGVFDSRPVGPANSPRIYRSKHLPAQQGEIEFTAFEFRH